MPDINKLLEPIRAEANIPALAAAVIKRGRLVTSGAVGRRRADSEEPIKRDDRFHIGSCTKSMTATVIAWLVERGKLDWGSMIAEVMPELRKQIRRDYWKVTIEQLLTHRSGLPDDRISNPAVFAQLWQLASTQRVRAAEIILRQTPIAKPGEKMVYSNGGYVVAGAMAEAASGKSWEALMAEVLFRPLRMKSAGFGAPPEGPCGHRASVGGYTPVPPTPFADNPPVLGPAGTVHLSLQDWARYAVLHLNGAQQEKPCGLSPASFAKLHTPPSGGSYAMGWGVVHNTSTKETLLQHAGSNTLWFAIIVLRTQTGDGWIAAANAGDNRAQNAVQKAIDCLRSAS